MSLVKAALALPIALFWAITWSANLSAPVLAQSNQAVEDPAVYFIGFNTLMEGQAAQDGFDAYLAGVTPIMARHGLSLQAYDAEALPGSDLETHVITIGAGTGSGMAAFFEDPDFLAIFPDLLVVLADHNVVFTEDDLGSAASVDMQTADVQAGEVWPVLGVFWPGFELHMQGELTLTKGIMASHGIGDTVEPLNPPGTVMIFQGEWPHGDNGTPRWIFRLKPRE